MGESADLSPVPSAKRTILHGTSLLFLKEWFSFIRNLESTCPKLSISLYPEPLAQGKVWVTSCFSSLANLLLLYSFPPPLKFYKLMTVCICSADGQKTWKEFLDFSPPVCLVWLACWEQKLASVAPVPSGWSSGAECATIWVSGTEWEVGDAHVTG